MYEDSGGNLWAGAANGLWRWKPGPPKLYPMPEAAPEIRALIEGDNGALLIAGLRRNQTVSLTGKPRRIRFQALGRQFSPNRLLRDRDGGLWIGTNDRGLLHVHQGRTDLFARSDGLSGDSVYNALRGS